MMDFFFVSSVVIDLYDLHQCLLKYLGRMPKGLLRDGAYQKLPVSHVFHLQFWGMTSLAFI